MVIVRYLSKIVYPKDWSDEIGHLRPSGPWNPLDGFFPLPRPA